MRSGSNVIDRIPPDTDHGSGGGGGWAWLLTVRGLAEAQLVRGVLESNGITQVVLDASDPSPGSWLFLSGNINALVRVLVPRAQLESARLALLEVSLAGDADDEELEPAPARGTLLGARVVWIAVTLVVLALTLLAAFRDPSLG